MKALAIELFTLFYYICFVYIGVKVDNNQL